MENEVKEAKTPWKRKPLTQEEIAVLKQGAEIVGKKVSKEAKRIVECIPAWLGEDKELTSEERKKLVESFGGSEKIREYFESEAFANDFADFIAISKVMPVVNVIKNYYAHRTSTARVSRKLVNVTIDGQLYRINEAYLQSIANKSKEERKALIMAHPSLVKVETEMF